MSSNGIVRWAVVPSQSLSNKQEEMKRGYFEDFKDLKETQGRMFEPSEALSPPSISTQLPNIAVRLITPSCSLFTRQLTNQAPKCPCLFCAV